MARSSRASASRKTPDSPLTIRQLNRATLARQMLLSRQRVKPLSAIERLAGLQAQQARPPFVGLWTRLDGFRRQHLLDLLHGRAVVRATAMRATLHLMSAADYIALRSAIQPALARAMQSALHRWLDRLDLTELEAEARAFFDEPRSFDAFRSHMKARRDDGLERVRAYATRTHLPLVQVPTDAAWGFPAAADFALADAWLGQKFAPGGAAAHALVRRYLAAFGPATPGDMQAWSGLQGLRAVFEEMRGELATFRDERKRELFDLPDAPRPDADTPAPVRFLPEFDNLILSHADRSRVVADEHRAHLVSKNLLVRATFLVDGIVAGAWRVERKKKVATLRLEPFGKLKKKELAALVEEGDALLAFVEEDAETREVRVDA